MAVAGVIAGGVPLWEMPAAQLAAVIEVDLGGGLSSPHDWAFRQCCVEPVAERRDDSLPWLLSRERAGCLNWRHTAQRRRVLIGLIRGLAAELRGTGITANTVSPGSTSTPMLDESARLYGLAAANSFATQQLIERLLDPDEVAATLAWLAGPQGAGLTGADVVVDGGLSV